MIFADQPILWLLVGVPPLALWIAMRLRRRRRLLEEFGQWGQVSRLVSTARFGVHRLRAALWLLAISFLIVALARPQFGEVEETILARGVDVIIAIDTSSSMLAGDIAPTRLQRAKTQLASLMSRLQGHRIGLICFAGIPTLQCPLTLDQTILHQMLSLVDQSAVSVPGTAIADTVRLAIRSFDEDSPRHRVLVLLTDGEDHLGDIDQAADEARDAGVIVYAVGIGTSSGSAVPQMDPWGRTTGFRQQPDGSPILTRLNTSTLMTLSTRTGGRAFEASDLGRSEIDTIARDIGALPQRELQEERISHQQEQFQVFVLIALVILILDGLLLTGRRARRRGMSSESQGVSA